MNLFRLKRRGVRCKDCDAVTISPKPIGDGWRWINLVDGEDVCNGWRCAHCVEGWETIEAAWIANQTWQ
jgi:hypothetical protein